MATKPLAPILPTSVHDPEGTEGAITRATAEFRRRLREVAKGYAEAIKRLPYQVVVTNADSYAYQLDQGVLARLLESMDWLVDEILLEGGEPDLWFWTGYIKPAYERGTARTIKNLARQSAAYKAERATLRDVIQEPFYQRRLLMLRAREFEEMKGFSGGVKADMARVLTDGLARGRNPLAIARNLTEQLGIEEYRAERIARTEINTGLRRARWDEMEDAATTYGLNFKQMHMSALSPTTRAEHASRHGDLFTLAEVRSWFAAGANSINCKCSTVEVLVDNEGVPVVGAIVDRAQAMRRKYEEDQDAI